MCTNQSFDHIWSVLYWSTYLTPNPEFTIWVWISVSYGTGQCNFLGQRDNSSFIVPGQRDDGMSWIFCRGTGRVGKACQNLGRDLGWDMISYFRTSFPVLERSFQFLNILSCFTTSFSCFRTSFFCFTTSFSCFLCSFGKVILSRDVPGQRSLSLDICSCPCPGTKGQRDAPSRFVPWDPLETLVLINHA